MQYVWAFKEFGVLQACLVLCQSLYRWASHSTLVILRAAQVRKHLVVVWSISWLFLEGNYPTLPFNNKFTIWWLHCCLVLGFSSRMQFILCDLSWSGLCLYVQSSCITTNNVPSARTIILSLTGAISSRLWILNHGQIAQRCRWFLRKPYVCPTITTRALF